VRQPARPRPAAAPTFRRRRAAPDTCEDEAPTARTSSTADSRRIGRRPGSARWSRARSWRVRISQLLSCGGVPTDETEPARPLQEWPQPDVEAGRVLREHDRPAVRTATMDRKMSLHDDPAACRPALAVTVVLAGCGSGDPRVGRRLRILPDSDDPAAELSPSTAWSHPARPVGTERDYQGFEVSPAVRHHRQAGARGHRPPEALALGHPLGRCGVTGSLLGDCH
jgi:hypothetical protein